MIERKFIAERIKEFQIQEYISQSLKNVGHSHTKLLRTPLGEKIVIYASRPGLIVGRAGENIKKLTRNTKKRYKLENPQIEINEVENIYLDANIVAERIASTLERFGPQRFKGIGHKIIAEVRRSGGRGIEILISGKIPGSRARRWRFYQGYLKKCGDLAVEGIRVGYSEAQLKTGTVGIQVRIMPPDIRLPDHITAKEESDEPVIEEVKPKKKAAKKKSTRKKTVRKTIKKKVVKTEPVKSEEKKEELPVEKTEEKKEPVKTEEKKEEQPEPKKEDSS